MASRGEKRQLKQLKKNLHEMLRSLGEQDGQSLIIQADEFQYLRQDFTKAANIYETSNSEISVTSDRKQRGILIYKLSESRTMMDNCLKKMATLVTHLKNKKNKKQSTAGKINKKKVDSQKIQSQIQYKCLTLYHLQKTYFQITKKEHNSAKKPQNYPDIQNIQDIKLRKPLHRGFSQESDHQSSEYLQEQQMLEAIKEIDNRIQQKMDYILEGIQMMNYNALSISEGIDNIHKKIMINVENLEQNLNQLQNAQDLLNQASPHASKPNCIMNVIIVLLLAIIAFLIIRKVIDVQQIDPNTLNS